MAKIRLINGHQARMIEATISLPAEELAQLLSANITDRHAAMVQQHGEACTKTTAAKILSCSTQTAQGPGELRMNKAPPGRFDAAAPERRTSPDRPAALAAGLSPAAGGAVRDELCRPKKGEVTPCC